MDKVLTSMDIKDPGLRSLPPGVERYLVKGGGLSLITLDPDDKIEITDTEGKQKCEIIVFNKSDLVNMDSIDIKMKNFKKKIKKSFEITSLISNQNFEKVKKKRKIHRISFGFVKRSLF